MKKVRAFKDRVKDVELPDEFDRVSIVLGDEGLGKSTFMVQLAWFWFDEPDIERVLGTFVRDKEELEGQMHDKNRAMINVPDAVHVMHRKEAMKTEHVEMEKSFIDSRIHENWYLLGYQNWDHVATQLAKQRAHNVFRIPRRGKVECYNRKQIDKKLKTGYWPSPSFVDTFADLSGTELWSRYQELDKEAKTPEEEEEEEEFDPEAVVDAIKENGVNDIISIHGGHNKQQYDTELIMHDYDITGSQAKLVRKLLERELGPADRGITA